MNKIFLLLVLILISSPVLAVEQYITAPPVYLPTPPQNVIPYPMTNFVYTIPSPTAPLQKNPWTNVPSQGFEKTTNYINIYQGKPLGCSLCAP